MNFIPEQPKAAIQDVPYFDDVTAADGWEGHATNKSVDRLKQEVMSALERLGASVRGFQRGIFVVGDKKREGFQIHYTVEQPGGILHRGRLDVAALPVKDEGRLQKTLTSRKDKSLKMALYMLREALNGTWFLQQLSPGYAPLMPWMLAKGDRTVTQLWSESVFTDNLLPSGDDFIDAEIVEAAQ
jgi:hypothetical protein